MNHPLLFLLACCAGAHAAPLPPLPVTRPKPVLSPRHASQPKSKAMFVPASVNPPLPMEASIRTINSQYGKQEFTAGALQPAGFGIAFYRTSTLIDRELLAEFGPVPYAQKSFVAFPTFSDVNFVTPKLIPQPANARAANRMAVGYVGVNTRLHDVRTWSVRK